MLIRAKNDKLVNLRLLNGGDFNNLSQYLHHLSENTRKRFAPHAFDEDQIRDIYEGSTAYLGYLAEEIETTYIIAYSSVMIGTLEHEQSRLASYSLSLDNSHDCTYAPSVADYWQGKGVGQSLFSFTKADLKTRGLKRVFLWGGVQNSNTAAKAFYHKNGFQLLGEFEYNGKNYDMMMEL